MKNVYTNHVSIKGIILLLLCCLASPAISDEEYETLENIQPVVDAFVIKNTRHAEDEKVSVTINQFENVKLSRCQTAVKASFSSETVADQSHVVLLECHAANNWRVFLPVHVQIMTPVLTTNRMMVPGDLITENDIVYENFDRNRLYDGYFKDKRDVLGLAVTRNIAAGAPLTKKNLKQMPLVKRNHTISLALRRGAIEIEMIGIAKTDGYMDSTIKVLNPSSKKIVDAVVTGIDRAEITY